MSEFTRPTAMLSYANATAVVASTIWLNNKIGATNTKITDLTEDVEAIRDGVKEKVPMIENSIKHLDNVIKNVASVVNNHAPVVKKADKRFNKIRNVLEEMSEAIETIEARQFALIDALKAKGVIDNINLDVQAPVVQRPAPKPVKVQHKSRRFSSASEDESSESSEEEKPKHKSSKKHHKSSKKHKDDSDEDEIDKVVRMARNK
jgi:hypothetical protein